MFDSNTLESVMFISELNVAVDEPLIFEFDIGELSITFHNVFIPA